MEYFPRISGTIKDVTFKFVIQMFVSIGRGKIKKKITDQNQEKLYLERQLRDHGVRY